MSPREVMSQTNYRILLWWKTAVVIPSTYTFLLVIPEVSRVIKHPNLCPPPHPYSHPSHLWQAPLLPLSWACTQTSVLVTSTLLSTPVPQQANCRAPQRMEMQLWSFANWWIINLTILYCSSLIFTALRQLAIKESKLDKSCAVRARGCGHRHPSMEWLQELQM